MPRWGARPPAALPQAHDRFAQEFSAGVESYRDSDAYSAYALYPDAPHCDKGVAPVASKVSGMAAYPVRAMHAVGAHATLACSPDRVKRAAV